MAWTDNDYRALIVAAGKIGCRPLDLALVLYSESALNPQAVAMVDGAPYARGLNQITPPNADAMGISGDEWVALSSLTPSEQLPYVVRSFQVATPVRSFRDAGELYQVNFAPASLYKGTADSLVLYVKGSGAYKNNKLFDTRGRGYITVGDLRDRLRKVAEYGAFKQHVARMKVIDPSLEGPVISGPFEWKKWALWGGVSAAVAAVVYAVGRDR